MKKWLALLFLCLVISSPAQAAEPLAEAPGKITGIRQGHVAIRGKNEQEIVLVGIEDAYIINGATGEKLSPADLTAGLSVTAWHSKAMTRSMPPQARAAAIIVGRGADTARYFPVAEVVYLSAGAVRILNTQSTQYLTITDDILPYPAQLRPGSELLAWYKVNALSMPGQATPSRVTILNKQPPDVIISLSAGVIAAGNREIRFDPTDRDGSLLLPLRDVAEALGYQVAWQPKERIALVKRSDGTTFTLAAGERTYNKNGGTQPALILKVAPRLINDTLYAPLEVFSELLGHSVQVNRDPV